MKYTRGGSPDYGEVDKGSVLSHSSCRASRVPVPRFKPAEVPRYTKQAASVLSGRHGARMGHPLQRFLFRVEPGFRPDLSPRPSRALPVRRLLSPGSTVEIATNNEIRVV